MFTAIPKMGSATPCVAWSVANRAKIGDAMHSTARYTQKNGVFNAGILISNLS